jgi:hypothetical protein
MSARRGERLGWLIGWAGGYLWIIALAILFLARGQLAIGLIGVAIAGLGYASVVFFSPWRHPRRRYWQLLLAPYLMMLAGVPWAILGFGPEAASALNWWQALVLLPTLSPFMTIGRLRWDHA